MQPHRFFITVALIFGFIYALIVPPFQSPDEFNHFYRSWQISDGAFVGKKTMDNRLGDSLPVSLLNISEPFTRLPFHFEEHIKTSTIFSALAIPLNDQQKTFIDFSNTTVYAPTAYLSQSAAIFLFKNVGLRPLSIFYLARLLTLIIWAIIVYASIKIIPIQKWLLVFLALLPSSLFINASLNADVLTNALSFLSISLFVKMFFEKNKISIFDISIFGISTLLISLNKIAYLPIALLVFLIPKENFRSLKQKPLFVFLILASNIGIVIGWSKIIAPLYIRFEDYNPVFRLGQQLNEGVDPMAQLNFILHNPLIYTKTMITSLAQTMPHTLIHYVGKFGWEKNYMPLWLILPLLLMIILRGHPDKVGKGCLGTELSIPTALKCKIFFVGCLMSASLATAMYLLWCRLGSDFIENLSGKYFIPIFPLFFLALPTIELKKKRFFTTENSIAALLLTTLIYGIWQVCTRYYIFN
jgi:uncharacterized membrane protein